MIDGVNWLSDFERGIGVVLFDDEHADSGWSSVNGEAGVRIHGVGDLDSSVIWITNLDFKLFRSLQLTSLKYVYDAQYFRTSVKLLISELGLMLEGDAKNACEVLSEIFQRVGRLGRQYFDVEPSNEAYRYNVLLQEKCLTGALRKKPHSNFDELSSAFSQSTQANQAMTSRKQPKGSNAYSFIYPRTPYAKWILSQPIPNGSSWERYSFGKGSSTFGIDDGRLIKGSIAMLDMVKELMLTKAGFFKVSVRKVDRRYQHCCFFGAGAGKYRGWASLPEILDLATYAMIELADGWVCDQTTLSAILPTEIPDQEFSYSRGLLLENLWTGIACSLHGSDYQPPVGAYFRAYDRILLGRAARSLEDHGYLVGSYGTGRIMLFSRKAQLPQVLPVITDLGLLPPVTAVQAVL